MKRLTIPTSIPRGARGTPNEPHSRSFGWSLGLDTLNDRERVQQHRQRRNTPKKQPLTWL